jgi:hypothetical protein
MAGYDQTIKVKAAYYLAAKNFFAFLNAVGKKYSRPIKIKCRYLKRGRFHVIVDGGSGGINALFQELILNRGLYYYMCSVSGNKRKTADNVIIPIFRQLLEERFFNPQSRILRRHIFAKVSQGEYIPGDFHDPFSHEYEVIFRKWDIGIIDDWNFIKDVDGFLTKFMLVKTEHQPGKRSPKFHVLVDLVFRSGVGMAKDFKAVFNKIHSIRTEGLHRLRTNISKDNISSLALELHSYFYYFDEFQESQKEKTTKLHGKRYRRIKYGCELWSDENGNTHSWDYTFHKACPDCSALVGQYHCSGCDIEQCPRCKGQYLGCSCKLQKDFE